MALSGGGEFGGRWLTADLDTTTGALAASTIGSAITTPDGVVVWANQAMCVLLGRTAAELVDVAWQAIVHPEDRAADEDLRVDLLAGAREAYRVRTRFVRPDGTVGHADSTVTAVRAPGSPVAALLRQVHDLTAEIATDGALVASWARLQGIVRSQLDPMALLDAVRDASGAIVDLELADLNDAALQRLGRARDELVGRRFSQLAPRARDMPWWPMLIGVIETGEPVAVPRAISESLLLGGARWFEYRAVKAGDGLALSWRDITDQQAAAEQALDDERVRLRAILDSELEPHITMTAVRDDSGRIVDFEYDEANQAALDYLGMTVAEFRGTRLLTMYPSAAARAMRDMFGRTVETGDPLVADDYTYPNERFGGEVRHYDLRGARLGDGLSLAWRDVTDRHRAIERLADSQRRYRVLAENVGDVIGMGATTGEVAWVSDSVHTLAGWRPDQVVGRRLAELVHAHDAEAIAAACAQVTTGRPAQVRARIALADGGWRWARVRLHPTESAVDGDGELVFSWQDIHDRVLAEQALDRVLGQDPLTGLAARSTFLDRLGRLLRTRPTAERVVVLCVGVDELSAVNNAFGHSAGDLALTTLARRLVEQLGDPALVARAAGVDFLAVLPTGSDASDAERQAERILRATAAGIPLGAHQVRLTASIGIASGRRGSDPERLVQEATLAMREAKRAGRNRVVFADPSYAADARHRLAVLEQARDGLAAGSFTPWFMPITRLTTGALAGYEALARWQHPSAGLLAPASFLAILERSPLVCDLDLAILAQSLRTLGTLPDPLFVSVNVSTRTLQDRSYADRALAAIEASGTDPRRLQLEVTETALLNVTGHVVDTLTRLSATGARVYVDDFGTGYSSISHLRDLPVSGIKLDMSFTRGVARGDTTSTRLAQALAGLARGLGLDTVAEGIESSAVAAQLATQGWRHGQGWLYGRATPRAIY